MHVGEFTGHSDYVVSLGVADALLASVSDDQTARLTVMGTKSGAVGGDGGGKRTKTAPTRRALGGT